MLLIIVLAVLTTVCGLLAHLIDERFDTDLPTFVVIIVAVLFGLSTLFAVIGIPFQRAETHAFAREFKAVELTIRQQREHGFTDYERFQLTKTIIEYNSKLAETQYYATSPWVSVFFSSDIMDLKPIN